MDWLGRVLAWLEPWLAYLLGLMQRSVTRPGRGRAGRGGARVEPYHLPVHARGCGLCGGQQEHHQAESGWVEPGVRVGHNHRLYDVRRALGEHRPAPVGLAETFAMALVRYRSDCAPADGFAYGRTALFQRTAS